MGRGGGADIGPDGGVENGRGGNVDAIVRAGAERDVVANGGVEAGRAGGDEAGRAGGVEAGRAGGVEAGRAGGTDAWRGPAGRALPRDPGTTGLISPEIWLSGTRRGSGDRLAPPSSDHTSSRLGVGCRGADCRPGQRGSSHCCGGHSASARERPNDEPCAGSAERWRPLDGCEESYRYASLLSAIEGLEPEPVSRGESAGPVR
jgi:hypothetical protein